MFHGTFNVEPNEYINFYNDNCQMSIQTMAKFMLFGPPQKTPLAGTRPPGNQPLANQAGS